MKNAKIALLTALLSVSGAVLADGCGSCCSEQGCEVNKPTDKTKPETKKVATDLATEIEVEEVEIEAAEHNQAAE